MESFPGNRAHEPDCWEAGEVRFHQEGSWGSLRSFEEGRERVSTA